MKKQLGISLTELLVSLFSSSLLILILMNQYLSVKHHYQHMVKSLDKHLDMQQIIDLMRDVARQAGFTPCMGLDYLATLDTRSSPKALQALEIHLGFQSNHMNKHYNLLLQQQSLTQWTTTLNVPLSSKKTVLISDCVHAEVHDIEKVNIKKNHQEIEFTRPLAYHYIPPVFIGEWVEEQFFVRSNILYYRSTSTESLSTAVQAMSVSFNPPLLQVNLRLDAKQSIKFETALRNI